MSKLNVGALPLRLVNALHELGHTNAAIENMSTQEAVCEYAAWHLGYGEWGTDFYSLVRALDAARSEDTK